MRAGKTCCEVANLLTGLTELAKCQSKSVSEIKCLKILVLICLALIELFEIESLSQN